MLSEKMQIDLNKQIKIKTELSQRYLAMTSWDELQGL